MQLIAWFSLLLHLIWIVGFFASRHWLQARIEKGVQHKFDRRIEEVKSDLRKGEEADKADLQAGIEALKATLQARDKELATLRDGVLSGRVQRQALVDKRRVEAVERVWLAVTNIGQQYRLVAGMLHRIDLSVASKQIKTNRSYQQFFEFLGKLAPVPNDAMNPARAERPFLTEPAWAYFTAFQTILVSAAAVIKALEAGFDEVDKMMDAVQVKTLLKTALPHRADFIEKSRTSAYFLLLDDLEQQLLDELRKILDGQEVDQAAVRRSAEIMELSKKMDAAASLAQSGAPAVSG